MKKRRLLWTGAVLLAVVCLGWLLVPPDPVSQIGPGMALEEVEAVFGRHGTPVPGITVPDGEEAGPSGIWYAWAVGARTVDVEFAAEGSSWVVLGRTTGRIHVQGLWSPFDRIRGWLGWF